MLGQVINRVGKSQILALNRVTHFTTGGLCPGVPVHRGNNYCAPFV